MVLLNTCSFLINVFFSKMLSREASGKKEFYIHLAHTHLQISDSLLNTTRAHMYTFYTARKLIHYAPDFEHEKLEMFLKYLIGTYLLLHSSLKNISPTKHMSSSIIVNKVNRRLVDMYRSGSITGLKCYWFSKLSNKLDTQPVFREKRHAIIF